jgi:osmoprotectant transport system ATP-binding protein
VIRFDAVGKDYSDGTVAIDVVSFTVPSHSIVALIGPSGAGKTTLLRMVNRMVEPTRGRVLIDEVDVRLTDPVALRRSIGYVLQSGGLMPHRTVTENVATVPILNGLSPRAARSRAADYLELVGLDARLGQRYPAQLSGGQQQRVGVARALAGEPNILLMDEPFGAVDPIVRRELQGELKRIQSELGKTIVLVTHDVDEALALADEIVVLGKGGRLAQRATPTELLSAPADDFVADFIGVHDPSRRLRVQSLGSSSLVTDGSGRPIGLLSQ